MTLHGGMDVRIEVLATRLDSAKWNRAGLPPMVGIHASDGTLLRQHEPARWARGYRDLEFPHWVPPTDGDYLVRLETEGRGGGRYVLRVHEQPFAPGVLVPELEPVGVSGQNDTSPEPIAPNTIVHGASEGDEDWFTFDLFAPSLVTTEVWKTRMGIAADQDSRSETALELTTMLPGLGYLGQQCGDPGFRQYRERGTYTLAVQHLTPGEYLVALDVETLSGVSESEPNDSFVTAQALAENVWISGNPDGSDDWFAFSGLAGDRIEVELVDRSFLTGGSADTLTLVGPDGASLVPLRANVSFRQHATFLSESGAHALHVQGTEAYWLRLRLASSGHDESEPNDTTTTAEPVPLGRASGRIGTPGDVDVFALDTEPGRLHRIRVYARRGSFGGFVEEDLGSFLRPRVTLRDTRGRVLAEIVSDDTFGSPLLHAQGLTETRPWADLAFVGPADGPCTLTIEDRTGSGGLAYAYAFELE